MQSGTMAATALPAFDQETLTYLTNVRNKYSTIKTLLYNEQQTVYDFCVCNTYLAYVLKDGPPFKRSLSVMLILKSWPKYHTLYLLRGLAVSENP